MENSDRVNLEKIDFQRVFLTFRECKKTHGSWANVERGSVLV